MPRLILRDWSGLLLGWLSIHERILERRFIPKHAAQVSQPDHLVYGIGGGAVTETGDR